VEVAKALRGSFKLVALTPKPVREMTQLPRETQKDGDTQTNVISGSAVYRVTWPHTVFN